MYKKSEINPTKKKIFTITQKLMLKKGYVATTIDEICDKAGLTKGSFFYYFKTKDQLGSDLLDYYWDELNKKMTTSVKPNEDPLGILFDFMDFVVKIYNTAEFDTSCLLGNFAQELSQTNEIIRKKCDNYLTMQIGRIRDLLDNAKKYHSVKKDLDTESLALSLIALIQGSILVAKSKKNKQVIKQSLKHYKIYLKSIFTKSNG